MDEELTKAVEEITEQARIEFEAEMKLFRDTPDYVRSAAEWCRERGLVRCAEMFDRMLSEK